MIPFNDLLKNINPLIISQLVAELGCQEKAGQNHRMMTLS